MKLVANKNLKNNAFEVILELKDISAEEQELLSDFGEQTINVGGRFTDIREVTEIVKVPKTEIIKVQKSEIKFYPVTDDNGDPVLDGNGDPTYEGIDTPIFEADGVTPVMEDKEVPVLDADGKPVMIDKEVKSDKEVTIADLGNIYRKFPSEFPLKRTFSVSEFGADAEQVANEYVALMIAETEIAVNALKAKKDVFSGVTEIQL